MLRSDVLLWEPYKMNKFAVVFAAAGLMALAACGEKPAATTNTSNEVVENVVENAAVFMENTADNATSNVDENAAEESRVHHAKVRDGRIISGRLFFALVP